MLTLISITALLATFFTLTTAIEHIKNGGFENIPDHRTGRFGAHWGPWSVDGEAEFERNRPPIKGFTRQSTPYGEKYLGLYCSPYRNPVDNTNYGTQSTVAGLNKEGTYTISYAVNPGSDNVGPTEYIVDFSVSIGKQVLDAFTIDNRDGYKVHNWTTRSFDFVPETKGKPDLVFTLDCNSIPPTDEFPVEQFYVFIDEVSIVGPN